jgi:hypothetical protein
LHAVTIARSVVHSKRTMPQWQPPVKVRVLDIGQLSARLPYARGCYDRDVSGKLAARLRHPTENGWCCSDQLVDPRTLSGGQGGLNRRLGRCGIVGIIVVLRVVVRRGRGLGRNSIGRFDRD